MTGKEKCKILRKIRRDIAAANELDYTERDCTHEGECRGTCPYCEAQLKRLEGALAERRTLGKRVALMGLSMGLLATNLSACDPLLGTRTLQGDMMPPDSPDTEHSVPSTEIPGEIVETQTTTEPPETMEMGEVTAVEPLMGDPVPEEFLMGMLLPPDEVETTALPEPEPILPTKGLIPVEEADLPDPDAP